MLKKHLTNRARKQAGVISSQTKPACLRARFVKDGPRHL